jgi:6-pyruvoyltetrahydropterin/6-carboxytetrahydropterin synthase
MKKVTVSRRAHFNAAHRLHNPAWTDEKNREVFGKCNRPNYHGHNYDLVVKVGGHIDLESGFVVDMKWLADLIDEVIVERFDHQNLNLDTVEFRNLNPTAENIAVVVWDLLRPHISMDKTLKVEIYETERNFVEYGGE